MYALILYFAGGELYQVTVRPDRDLFEEVRRLHDEAEFNLRTDHVYIARATADGVSVTEVWPSDVGLG